LAARKACETIMNLTTLVLLPGLDGTEILFGPLLHHLPSWIHPVVIEYPIPGANNYETLLEIVDKEVASLGSFAILGWSFGGPLALMIAARRPSQVSAVVLCASFVTPPIPKLVPFRSIVITPVFAIFRTFRRLRFWIPGFASNDLRRAKAAIWRRVGARVLAARSRAIMILDARPLLKACRAPMLYLASKHDQVVRRPSLEEVIAIAPQTKVAEVAGSHLALFTNPADSAARIAEFLSSADPATSAR
jgi:pimeloyl-[acyl-carrier protein] methyl ester esterase